MRNIIYIWISIIFISVSYDLEADVELDSIPMSSYLYFELGTNKLQSSLSNGSLGFGFFSTVDNIDLVLEGGFSYLSLHDFNYDLVMFDIAFTPRYNFRYTENSGFYTALGIGISSSSEPDSRSNVFDVEDERNTVGFLTKIKFGYRLNVFEIYGMYRMDFTELESFKTFNFGILYRL